MSDLNTFSMGYYLFCFVLSYLVMNDVSLSSHNYRGKEKGQSAALRHNVSEDYSANACPDIPDIIDFEKEELSDATDTNHNCNTKIFRNNKTYNEFLINNSILDPTVSVFNPTSTNTLCGKTSNVTIANNNDIYTILNDIRVQNIHRIIIGHLNINSIRNKFDALSDIIKNKIDIMLISETKIDDSFPNSSFSIEGFTPPYRKDRTNMGGGIMLYVRDDIPSKDLKAIYLSIDKEYIFIEINLYMKKWLICGVYNPSKNQIKNLTMFLSQNLDHYLSLYDNIIILGDFNAEPLDTYMHEFINMYGLKNLVNEPTCYKNVNNPSCIDLILTNRPKSFQTTTAIETGLSDFHKMTITIMKTFFKKKKPKIIQYRDYKKFSNTLFRTELMELLYTHDVNNIDYNDFDNLVMGLINAYAPIKYKYIRANEAPFMNKEFKKAIMVRSKLKNIYNREKSESAHSAYKKQRNLCSNLLKKIKTKFYSNLNPSSISDNKTFWSTTKPIFSDKKSYNININLIENNNIVTEDIKIAECFKNHFENSVKVLNIDMDPNLLSTTNNIDNVMNYIDKFKIHPSVLKIKCGKC